MGPTLKVLDFTKIKQSEREKAKRLSMSAAGAALESDVQLEAREAAAATSSSSAEETLTFVPGAGASATEAFSINFTLEQKAQIRDLVANANSSAEIEKIERFVKRGEFPMFPYRRHHRHQSHCANEAWKVKNPLRKRLVRRNNDFVIQIIYNFFFLLMPLCQ